MGYPYHELIPAAVLLDNPGITREEFVELLDQTHCSGMGYSKDEPLDSHFRDEFGIFHRGLHGLAKILGLRKTSEFEQYCTTTINEKGIETTAPKLHLRHIVENGVLMPTYEVYEKKERLKQETAEIKEILPKTSQGDILFNYYGKWGLVEEVVSEKRLKRKGKALYYTLRIREYEVEGINKKFSTLEELVQEYPQFHPERMYDFSASSGILRLHINNESDFRWKKENERYYLDEEHTFNHIPGYFSIKGCGYTDLILTAEAIKHKAWKVLAYEGREHLGEFFKTFPSSKEKYERAVWDAHTSLWAKRENKTYSELLRMRNSPVE